jgi:tRNA nucleotidyltransferase (CCA-adding enzyme)
LLHESEYPSLERSRNLAHLMTSSLSKDIIVLLRSVGEVGDEQNCNVFVVGGFVRDLLLKKPNMDLDIVVEGDGISFAKKLAEKMSGRVRIHERFGTATLVLDNDVDNELKLDVATARLEYYEYPAALPTVELSSIKLDLYRRDFTINAMAIRLNGEHFGKLIDFFNSQNDLKQHAIKVLHNLSFVDDPTRIFRAIRFETRMNFIIVKHTERLIRNAVKMNLFGKADDPRFFTELKILFSEEHAIQAIHRLAEFGLFPYLWPNLKPHHKIDRRLDHYLNQAQRAISWFKLLYLEDEFEIWIVYLLTILARSPVTVLTNFCNRFQLAPKTKAFLIDEKTLADKTAHFLTRRKYFKNSETYTALRGLHIEGLLYVMAVAQKSGVKREVSQYVTTMRSQQCLLNGEDLKELGYRPGPLFKTILETLLMARLDGKIETRQEEIDLVKRKYSLTN